MSSISAEIVWFDDVIGYGFATTADGIKIFVHKRNFFDRNQRSSDLVQGTTIQCELRPEVDEFVQALNEGRLRDTVGKNHRNPRRILGADAKNKQKHPVAIKIRVVSGGRL